MALNAFYTAALLMFQSQGRFLTRAPIPNSPQRIQALPWLKRPPEHAYKIVLYVKREHRAIEGYFLMRTITIFSSACLGLSVVACGVMWGLGIFSGVGVGTAVGAMFGILLAAAIGTALMALAVYSDQSGHDEVIFRVEKESDSAQVSER